MPVKVTTMWEPVMGPNWSGTSVTAPPTLLSATAGSLTLRVTPPAAMVSDVGTEWRPSAMTCRVSVLSVIGAGRL